MPREKEKIEKYRPFAYSLDADATLLMLGHINDPYLASLSHPLLCGKRRICAIRYVQS